MGYTKFHKQLNEYDYVLGVDLATYKTGVCLFDLTKKKFVLLQEIVVKKESEQKNLDLYYLLLDFCSNLKRYYPGRILIVKEACPIQNGPHSTINTLQSLAASHAVLDICAGLNNGFMDLYDEKGIYTISVKALFKSESIPKPQKEDIRRELVKIYNLDDAVLTDNISDAVGVVYTLFKRKWNEDIKEEIKELKKAIKGLKRDCAIQLKKEEILRLEQMKIKEEDYGK